MTSLIPFAAAIAGALAIGLAFPKTNWWFMAPIGAVGLFWAWFGVAPGRAFLIGWAAGFAYFALTLSWFGETAGALLGHFGFIVVAGPALIEALSFGFAGVLASLAMRRCTPAFAPLAAAAGFALLESVRSSGPLGVPLSDLGYTQVNSLFAPLGAFFGVFGITFALVVLAAYAAADLRRTELRWITPGFAVALAATLATTALASAFWPARTIPKPTVRVAAVQGNIKQTLKWRPETFDRALNRYIALSTRAAAFHPALILWPETVITTELNRAPSLDARFADLARAIGTELVVGTHQTRGQTEYNVLYFYRRDGGLDGVYRKRRLVPFAETLPGRAVFRFLPGASLISDFGSGDSSGVLSVRGFKVAPLICWESAFTGLTNDSVRDGARALLIATDDAWFGETAGPYQHAQIAQMRAIETGSWVVRAASTGISGIIAPDGQFVAASKLNEQTVVIGKIGQPVGSLYNTLGPAPVTAAFALTCLFIFGSARRRKR